MRNAGSGSIVLTRHPRGTPGGAPRSMSPAQVLVSGELALRSSPVPSAGTHGGCLCLGMWTRCRSCCPRLDDFGLVFFTYLMKRSRGPDAGGPQEEGAQTLSHRRPERRARDPDGFTARPGGPLTAPASAVLSSRGQTRPCHRQRFTGLPKIHCWPPPGAFSGRDTQSALHHLLSGMTRVSPKRTESIFLKEEAK